jgi:hypothetical protein
MSERPAIPHGNIVAQMLAQQRAQDEAKETGKPARDGYGMIWLPPGPDGFPLGFIERKPSG